MKTVHEPMKPDDSGFFPRGPHPLNTVAVEREVILYIENEIGRILFLGLVFVKVTGDISLTDSVKTEYEEFINYYNTINELLRAVSGAKEKGYWYPPDTSIKDLKS